MKSLRESLKVEKEQKAKLQKVRYLVDFLSLKKETEDFPL